MDGAILDMTAALRDELASNDPPPVIDPRTVPIRFSRLRAMSSSPLHYWQAVQDDIDDTIAMRFGRGVHALVLGTPVIRWDGKTRQGGKWDDFQKKHADKEILNTKEWGRAHGILDAINRHADARDLLFGQGSVLEETIEWDLIRRSCSSRPDARLETERNVDLKTTRCSEPRRFSRDATSRGYHAQFSFYARAIKERFGRAPRESLCVAVESKKPYAITVLKFSDFDLIEGEKCWRLWFEQVRQCEAAMDACADCAAGICDGVRHWPPYVETIVPFDITLNDDPGLVIGGEEYRFDDD